MMIAMIVMRAFVAILNPKPQTLNFKPDIIVTIFFISSTINRIIEARLSTTLIMA